MRWQPPADELAKLPRREQLYYQQPDIWPDGVEVSGLWNPPGPRDSNAHLRDYRDRALVPHMMGEPDNPNCLQLWARLEEILMWRMGLAAEDRFWKADEPGRGQRP
jgi:hypothetical protein